MHVPIKSGNCTSKKRLLPIPSFTADGWKGATGGAHRRLQRPRGIWKTPPAQSSRLKASLEKWQVTDWTVLLTIQKLLRIHPMTEWHYERCQNAYAKHPMTEWHHG